MVLGCFIYFSFSGKDGRRYIELEGRARNRKKGTRGITYAKLEGFWGLGHPVPRNHDVGLGGDALGYVEEHTSSLGEGLDGDEDGVEDVGGELAVGGSGGKLLWRGEGVG